MPALAREAVAKGAKVLWMQLGIRNDEAARIASDAGLDVVMDRCVKIEHARIMGGLHWAGVNTGVISVAAAATRPTLPRSRHAMADRKFGFDTLCLHAGQIPDAATGARALPIYQTTSFVFDSADHAASLFNLQTFGNVYSRISNPTVAALEERVAALEGGRAALAAATGMAAQMLALLTLCRNGDHIVAARTLYGGTYSQLAVTFAQFGIDATFVDADDPGEFPPRAHAATRRRVYAETIGNPQLNVCDIAALADDRPRRRRSARRSTTRSRRPFCAGPIEHGADIVIHSVTKYLGGHGTTMGGVVVESGKFPWDNGNFPQMTEPSRGYHGVRFYETFGDFGFTMKARMETMRTLGPTLAPLSAFLLLQGIETLHLRMPRHCESALAVARHLAAHPAVEWVNYPLLPGNRYEPLARRYLPRGAGGILTFGVRGGAAAGERFIEARAVPLAPRQHRRRQDAGHPSGVDDAPAAVRGRAARGRRDAGDDPAVGRARDAGRYPLGPRPGVGESTAMMRYAEVPWPWAGLTLALVLLAQEALLKLVGDDAVAGADVVAHPGDDDRRHVARAHHPAAAAAGVPAGRAHLRGPDGVGAVAPVRARASSPARCARCSAWPSSPSASCSWSRVIHNPARLGAGDLRRPDGDRRAVRRRDRDAPRVDPVAAEGRGARMRHGPQLHAGDAAAHRRADQGLQGQRRMRGSRAGISSASRFPAWTLVFFIAMMVAAIVLIRRD